MRNRFEIRIEAEQDDDVDGRWMANVGVVAYGATRDEAMQRARALLASIAASISIGAERP